MQVIETQSGTACYGHLYEFVRATMTKKEFIKKVLTMTHPVMRSCRYSERDLPELCFVIQDTANIRNKFCTPGVKMSYTEYVTGKASNYYKREKQLRLKIEKWLYDVCGNYCTIKP